MPVQRLNRADRRSQLLDATLGVLVEAGFDAINIEAVARRAGVTRPVVYDSFGDLQSLLVALIERADVRAQSTLREVLGDSDPAPGVVPDRFVVDSVLGFLHAVRSDPDTWRLVLMPPAGNSPELTNRIHRARREIAKRVEALVDWGVAARGGPAGLDHELLARLIVAIGEDAARLMLAHPRRFSPERLSAATELLLSLIPPHAGGRGAALLPSPTALPPAPPSGTEPGTPGASGRRARMPQVERREQLLDVTLELLAEEGFTALSMESVARRADVNRVVIYRSFANLAILLTALMQREDRRVRATLRGLIPPDRSDAPVAQVLLDAFAHLLGAVTDQPQTWRMALLRPESAPRLLHRVVNRRRAALARRIEPLVTRAFAQGGAQPSEDQVEAIARMLLTIGEEQARLLLDEPEAFPPERLLSATAALLGALA